MKSRPRQVFDDPKSLHVTQGPMSVTFFLSVEDDNYHHSDIASYPGEFVTAGRLVRERREHLAVMTHHDGKGVISVYHTSPFVDGHRKVGSLTFPDSVFKDREVVIRWDEAAQTVALAVRDTPRTLIKMMLSSL